MWRKRSDLQGVLAYILALINDRQHSRAPLGLTDTLGAELSTPASRHPARASLLHDSLVSHAILGPQLQNLNSGLPPDLGPVAP